MRAEEAVVPAIEFVAVLATAFSGFAEARNKKMDSVGVFTVAFITAFGGGTLRDVLLDRRPFFWVAESGWVWVILAMCVAGVALMRGRHIAPTERAILLPDALGLGLFTVVGARMALEMGMPTSTAVLMGVVTSVFGGVLRDVLCNEIPAVFRDHRPYAICAFAGAWVFAGLDALGAAPLLSMLGGAGCAAGARILALARGWQVPGWRND